MLVRVSEAVFIEYSRDQLQVFVNNVANAFVFRSLRVATTAAAATATAVVVVVVLVLVAAPLLLLRGVQLRRAQ